MSALPSPEHMLRMIEDPDVPRDRLVATIKALWKISNTLIDQVASLTVDLAEARAQEGAESAPSRAADGLAGSGWHPGTPATGEARKSAESDALPAGPFPPPHRYPTPIIEWLASVGLDASLIPVDGARIVANTKTGGCMLRVQCFEVAADGKRVILADGSGFARTAPRHFEVTTLPPEPWLTEWSAPPADADDDAEWDAREAIERARGGR